MCLAQLLWLRSKSQPIDVYILFLNLSHSRLLLNKNVSSFTSVGDIDAVDHGKLLRNDVHLIANVLMQDNSSENDSQHVCF